MALYAEHDGVSLDYARQRVTKDTMHLLFDLARAADLQGKMAAMARGDRINVTEDRSVLHMALRAAKGDTLVVDGVDVNAEVWDVLDRIRAFTERVRSGEHRGATGKVIKNVIAVGIGGSYLGPDFVHEALKTERDAAQAAAGRTLHFLSNVDPVDVLRNTRDLDPEETVVVVISKTFTTRETKVNAKTLRDWLHNAMGKSPDVVAQHMVACSTNMEGTSDFGISPENVFPFWDWVGGRFSVCSSVGALPIALQYGFDSFERFLEGARSMDKHWQTAPMERNLPVLMGLLGVWNMSSSATAPARCTPTRRRCSSSRPRAASRHGVQRQARDARRGPGRLPGRGGGLWGAGHQRPALLFPAAAHGPNGAVRLYRLYGVPKPHLRGGRARLQPRRACCQLFRAARRARQWQDRGGVPRRRALRGAHPPRDLPRQPPVRVPPPAPVQCPHVWPAAGAVRAPDGRGGLCVEHQLV
eukprot:TRINITY_DN3120_c0_g1_i2.p1 TRINITY_DN3120_c0_g1~~TRINITY_DN3120_c0_g1_i2.p1  ORF type:complete len:547 (+),score=114.04 TRINITY_DN3120_c0_g1_i2:231-1643(+)